MGSACAASDGVNVCTPEGQCGPNLLICDEAYSECENGGLPQGKSTGVGEGVLCVFVYVVSCARACVVGVCDGAALICAVFGLWFWLSRACRFLCHCPGRRRPVLVRLRRNPLLWAALRRRGAAARHVRRVARRAAGERSRHERERPLLEGAPAYIYVPAAL